MFTSLYQDLFYKHRAFHHYFQHFLVAIIGFALCHYLLFVPLNLSSLLLFLFVSYIVDLDGFLALFRLKKQIPELNDILTAIKNRHYKHAMVLSVIHHKKNESSSDSQHHRLLGCLHLFIFLCLFSSFDRSNHLFRHSYSLYF
jgi:hypothetical protein